MSTLITGTVQSITTAPPVFKNSSGTEKGQLAKAWVNFDGTFGTSPFTTANGGIRSAFNVSSVTDNGTGDYTVNFSSAMSNANYCPVQMTLAEDTSGCQRNTVLRGNKTTGPTTMTASACRINTGSTSSNVFSDSTHVFFAAFGD